MDRTTAQKHIACTIYKHAGHLAKFPAILCRLHDGFHQNHIAGEYNPPMQEGVFMRLAELEVDVSATNQIGKLGFRKYPDCDIRVAMRVGKFVRKYFGDHFSDLTIQNIGTEITALLWVTKDDSGDGPRVEELSGEELRAFYLITNSKIGSCMAHEDTQKFLDIYVDNPDVVKLAAVRVDGRAARALIWTFPNGCRYMDRLYYSSDAAAFALRNYAVANGIEDRESFPSTKVTMKIRAGVDSYWPYLDTMMYMSIIDHTTCTLSASHGDYCLQRTDGYLEEDDVGSCHECGDRLYDEDAYIGADDQTYCEQCYYDLFTTCDRCSEVIYENHGVRTADGCTVCENCFANNFFDCADCGRIYAIDCAHENNVEEYVCKDCFEENYFVCDECKSVCCIIEQKEGPDDTAMCEECAENYAKCNRCNDVKAVDNLVDGFCSDCAMEEMIHA